MWIAKKNFTLIDERGNEKKYGPGDIVDVRRRQDEKALVISGKIRRANVSDQPPNPGPNPKPKPKRPAPPMQNIEHQKPYPMRHVQISLCCGARNRRAHLERTVPAALAVKGIRHVVVADFGSTDGSLEYLKGVCNDRLLVVECKGAEKDPWNAPVAINTAWKAAAALGANIVGCFDADVLLAENYAQEVARALAPGYAVTLQERCERGCGLAGTMAARVDDLARIGGYDERMGGWGHYDTDIRRRLDASGGINRHPNGLLEHISHGDDSRGKPSQEKNMSHVPLKPGEQGEYGWKEAAFHINGNAREYGGGLLYVVSGDRWRRQTEWSILSARLWNPGIQIAVVGEPVAEADMHIPVPELPGHGARAWKTAIGAMAPFPDKTIYLDSDTVVCSPLDPLFEALDHYDFIAACDFVPCVVDDTHLSGADKRAVLAEVCPAQPQYNSGVLGFTPAAKPTLAAWHEEWRRIPARPAPDQGALMRAVWRTKPRMLTLGRTWNGPRDGSRIWHRNYEQHPNMQGRNGPIANIRDMEERRMLRGYYLRG